MRFRLRSLIKWRVCAEFGHGYSSGPTPQLIASNGNTAFDNLGAEGSLNQAEVGFLAGFFNDEACLSAHYGDFSAVIRALETLKQTGSVEPFLNQMQTRTELYNAINYTPGQPWEMPIH